MKNPIRKLTSLLIFGLVLYSCSSKEELKFSFEKAEIDSNTEKLLDIYLESLPKLNNTEFVLTLDVVNYNANHYEVIINNFYKEYDVCNDEKVRGRRFLLYKGFRTYIVDEKNKISSPSKEKISVFYPKQEGDIAPDGYEGNAWHIQFKDKTLAEMRLTWTKKSIREIAEQKIRQIYF
jgi:hypothetical protein